MSLHNERRSNTIERRGSFLTKEHNIHQHQLAGLVMSSLCCLLRSLLRLARAFASFLSCLSLERETREEKSKLIRRPKLISDRFLNADFVCLVSSDFSGHYRAIIGCPRGLMRREIAKQSIILCVTCLLC
jgi:hypothetical protein